MSSADRGLFCYAKQALATEHFPGVSVEKRPSLHPHPLTPEKQGSV